MLYAIPTDTCFWLACPMNNETGFLEIYKLKWRDFNKPLSIVIKNFDDLNNYIKITKKQIDFLKKYPYPFTILWEINNNFLLPDFLDKNIYSRVAIRIASVCLDRNITGNLEFPLFLTSANLSWQGEIYNSEEIVRIFWNKNIEIFPWKIDFKPASNIFEFIDDSLDINFIRKNY